MKTVKNLHLWRHPKRMLVLPLLAVSLSAFAQSERFHLPALPFSLILASLGISMLSNKHKKWFNYWLVFMFVIFMGWTWFKLKGRG